MPADTLVLVPTYNEVENLPAILDRIRAALPDADVLVIDDDSPDGTGRLADEHAAADEHVRVLHRTTKEGLGRAYLAGFQRALDEGYEFVVEIDADGSHDPADLPRLLAAARGGADLVIGSRWIEGGAIRDWAALRQAISRSGNRYARIALGSHVHDLTAGFRVFRARVLRSIRLETVASHGYGFQVEMAWRTERAGFTIREEPVTFVERVHGTSKMHLGIVLEALWRVTGWGVRARFGRRVS